MKVFELLLRDIKTTPKAFYPVISFAVVSGLSNAFLIATINSAVETVANNDPNWQYLFKYLLCLFLFFHTRRYMLDRSIEIVESVVSQIRLRLVDKVRLTELVTLEKYGSATIYARITQDATIVSNSSRNIINGVQQSILIIFILFYIATISLWSFGFVILGLITGMFYYIGLSNNFQAMWKRVSEEETAFFSKLAHLLQGFNEISINRRKNEDVFETYVTVNDKISDYRIKTIKRYNITLIFLQVFFYILLGLILFALPRFHAEHSEHIIKIVAAILFMVGPMDGVIYSVPTLANANNSAHNIMELESQLKEELKKMREQRIDPYSPDAYRSLPFQSGISLKGLSYQYPQSNGYGTGFQVGPIDLTIRKGELIFVTGGNGSGKSTFLKLFTGLYKPDAGQIRLDEEKDYPGKEVNMLNYQQYQNLFSIIFSDYHLFDKIYGVEREIDPDEVKALLASMELPEEKTTYIDGAFTNINLSSGQKKRLALTTALLEDKPIYIFDEVAADLDPEFRDKFYFEILKELKARNKTILVVSHDQQYWSVSDRLIRFQDGMMWELSKVEVRSLVEKVLK
ncbi:MAG: cyclic peptide export ABC transporter [Lewinellaceae bacterium]|nr:cyclic peptide export ABC transporter [Phaeodactylibacter sp.]MCB9348856.1 cyclic peptide export ABC transporter [Lewinellaceae bacterium]